MPIPNEITDILSQFSVPAGAIALAVGLVRGAKALEKDASEPALKYVSGLLIGGSVADFGKLGATLIPIIFDRIFGSRPLSYKFISRSFLATTVFWLILLMVKHPDWKHLRQDFNDNLFNWYLIPGWYVLDLLSLIKARLIIRAILQKLSLLSMLVFFLIDISVSYILVLLWAALLTIIFVYYLLV